MLQRHIAALEVLVNDAINTPRPSGTIHVAGKGDFDLEKTDKILHEATVEAVAENKKLLTETIDAIDKANSFPRGQIGYFSAAFLLLGIVFHIIVESHK